MATKGFTKIDNSIIFDNNLSIEAIGLYVKLKYFSSIPDFQIKRDHIKSVSGYGETAFRRIWRELKDKGILIENKLRVKGRYEFVFTLINSEVVKEKPEAIKSKPKDSDGNIPLEGQLTINDILEEISEEIQILTKETGFSDKQANDLLSVADVRTIINYFRYAASKGKKVKNKFAYTKKLIIDKAQIVKERVSGWTNYDKRTYDFNKLESALYGECSLSEAIIY